MSTARRCGILSAMTLVTMGSAFAALLVLGDLAFGEFGDLYYVVPAGIGAAVGVLSLPVVLLSLRTKRLIPVLLIVFVPTFVVGGALAPFELPVIGSFSAPSVMLWLMCLLGAVAAPDIPAAFDPSRCRSCDYDLTGNDAGRCPECGQPSDEASPVIRRRRHHADIRQTLWWLKGLVPSAILHGLLLASGFPLAILDF